MQFVKKLRRVTLSFYCLLVAYCLLWIPWCVPHRDSTCGRVGYGWLWAGPAYPEEASASVSEPAKPIAPPPPRGFTEDIELRDIFVSAGIEEAIASVPKPAIPQALQKPHDRTRRHRRLSFSGGWQGMERPDLELVTIRLLAASVACGGLLILIGIWSPTSKR